MIKRRAVAYYNFLSYRNAVHRNWRTKVLPANEAESSNSIWATLTIAMLLFDSCTEIETHLIDGKKTRTHHEMR